MACPFSTKIEPSDDERDVSKSTRNSKDRSKPSRQSSVQIACSLLGEDNDDIEDTQTLNLKHLRAAVLVLTNPSVYYCTYDKNYLPSRAQWRLDRSIDRWRIHLSLHFYHLFLPLYLRSLSLMSLSVITVGMVRAGEKKERNTIKRERRFNISFLLGRSI